MTTITRAAVLAATMLGASATPIPAQRGPTAAYLAARDSAIESLTTRAEHRDSTFVPPHDSALASLTDRLRVVIGPVHAKGFSGAGHINLVSLFRGDEGFGMLDALWFPGDDHKSTLWVTTRALVAAKAERDGQASAGVEGVLREAEYYSQVVSADAAVVKYATVTIPDARELGVVQAMTMQLEQDTSPLPPDEVLVAVVRGERVYIVTALVAAAIWPPARCGTIRDSIENAVGFGSAAPARAFAKCYTSYAQREPRFARLIAQVRSIAAHLPRH